MSIKNPDGGETFLMALEGPDRLGKSTQAAMLKEALSHSSYQFGSCVIKIPWKDDVTYDRIYEMLFSGEATEHPAVFQSWQALNRHLFQKTELPRLCALYDLIILDRWNMSTQVYGAASGVLPSATDMMLKGLHDPDLTFIFSGEPFAMESEADSYEKDTRFQEKVREGYRRIAEIEDDSVIQVSANRDPKEVSDSILREIGSFMLSRQNRWA